MNLYLDIAISLLLIFVIFSVVVYVIQEIIAINLEYRGKMLWNSLAQALDGLALPKRTQLHKDLPEADAPLTTAVFASAPIRGLMMGKVSLPSYIHCADFAKAIITVIAGKAKDADGEKPIVDKLARFRAGIDEYIKDLKNLKGTRLEEYLPPMVDVLKGLSTDVTTLEQLENEIGDWFNRYMSRVSGWYQSHVVATVRIIAVGVTLFFNLNVIFLVRSIANDSGMRANLVGIAERVADHPEQVTTLINKQFDSCVSRIHAQEDPKIDGAVKNGDSAQARLARQSLEGRLEDATRTYTAMRIQAVDSMTKVLSATNLPIGWHLDQMGKDLHTAKGDLNWGAVGLLLLGWLIMAGCLSMGAPFWFSVLIQFVNIRRAGTKPGGDKKE